jgi:hypothetical protein
MSVQTNRMGLKFRDAMSEKLHVSSFVASVLVLTQRSAVRLYLSTIFVVAQENPVKRRVSG